FDLPSNTTDIIVVRCEEELKSWEQQMEVLLIKRGNHPGIGFWATPGGFVEMRENMDEGAARELEEETGIQGLPLVQMATWGDYDRDPRWRVITTSYLALVEGDLAVQAGDDAADALWFKVSLKQESNDTENRIEVWDLSLVNDERMIRVGAKVELIHSGHKLLDKKQYRIVENNFLAADHGCLITQALLYLKEKLERQ
ncbi:MAG: NUDIX hydrolase, partial [Lachnospiraceae bacterium]|nr:NUDIX hydrolase [Lachnospiraceae bacterium]